MNLEAYIKLKASIVLETSICRVTFVNLEMPQVLLTLEMPSNSRGTLIALRCSINFRAIDYTSPHYFVN